MKQTKTAQSLSLHASTGLERRDTARMATSFGLMYSALDDTGVLMGDGMVIDLSRGGLGIRGNRPVRAGMELTLFFYLPNRADPLFVLQAHVAWTNGRQFGVQFNRLSQREGERLQTLLLAQSRR